MRGSAGRAPLRLRDLHATRPFSRIGGAQPLWCQSHCPTPGNGPSRHFAATQQFGRSRSEADIERFSVCAEPVAFDPRRKSPLLTNGYCHVAKYYAASRAVGHQASRARP